MCRCLLASRSRVHVCTLIRYPVFDIISMMRLSALAAFFIQYHGFLLQIWWKGHRLESLPPLPLPFERGYWWRRDECGAWRETSRKCVYMLSAWSVGKYISVKLAHNAGLYRCHGSSVQDPPNKIFHVGGYLFHKCICSAQFQQVLEWGLRWSVAFFVQCINKPLWLVEENTPTISSTKIWAPAENDFVSHSESAWIPTSHFDTCSTFLFEPWSHHIG